MTRPLNSFSTLADWDGSLSRAAGTNSTSNGNEPRCRPGSPITPSCNFPNGSSQWSSLKHDDKQRIDIEGVDARMQEAREPRSHRLVIESQLKERFTSTEGLSMGTDWRNALATPSLSPPTSQEGNVQDPSRRSTATRVSSSKFATIFNSIRIRAPNVAEVPRSPQTRKINQQRLDTQIQLSTHETAKEVVAVDAMETFSEDADGEEDSETMSVTAMLLPTSREATSFSNIRETTTSPRKDHSTGIESASRPISTWNFATPSPTTHPHSLTTPSPLSTPPASLRRFPSPRLRLDTKPVRSHRQHLAYVALPSFPSGLTHRDYHPLLSSSRGDVSGSNQGIDKRKNARPGTRFHLSIGEALNASMSHNATSALKTSLPPSRPRASPKTRTPSPDIISISSDSPDPPPPRPKPRPLYRAPPSPVGCPDPPSVNFTSQVPALPPRPKPRPLHRVPRPPSPQPSVISATVKPPGKATDPTPRPRPPPTNAVASSSTAVSASIATASPLKRKHSRLKDLGAVRQSTKRAKLVIRLPVSGSRSTSITQRDPVHDVLLLHLKPMPRTTPESYAALLHSTRMLRTGAEANNTGAASLAAHRGAILLNPMSAKKKRAQEGKTSWFIYPPNRKRGIVSGEYTTGAGLRYTDDDDISDQDSTNRDTSDDVFEIAAPTLQDRVSKMRKEGKSVERAKNVPSAHTVMSQIRSPVPASPSLASRKSAAYRRLSTPTTVPETVQGDDDYTMDDVEVIEEGSSQPSAKALGKRKALDEMTLPVQHSLIGTSHLDGDMPMEVDDTMSQFIHDLDPLNSSASRSGLTNNVDMDNSPFLAGPSFSQSSVIHPALDTAGSPSTLDMPPPDLDHIYPNEFQEDVSFPSLSPLFPGPQSFVESHGIPPWDYNGTERSSPSPLADPPSQYGVSGTIDPSLLGGVSLADAGARLPSASPPQSPSIFTAPMPPENKRAPPQFWSRQSRRSLRQSIKRIPHNMVFIEDLNLSSASSSSDESDFRTSSKPPPVRRSVSPPKPLKAPRAKPGLAKRPIWPVDITSEFCHQCRATSLRRRMYCSTTACGKAYCVKCISNWYYDTMEFDEDAFGFVCPWCNGNCKCDQCCRRRGEVYVPLRNLVDQPPTPVFEADTAKSSTKRRRVTSETMTPTPPPPLTGTKPVSGPVKYWATIYGFSGEKVGHAFVGDDGNEAVVVAEPVPKQNTKVKRRARRRVFAGTAQESWRIPSSVAIRELNPLRPGESGENNVAHGSQRTFIGAAPPKRRSWTPLRAPPESHFWLLSPGPLTPLTSDEEDDLGTDDGAWAAGDHGGETPDTPPDNPGPPTVSTSPPAKAKEPNGLLKTLGVAVFTNAVFQGLSSIGHTVLIP